MTWATIAAVAAVCIALRIAAPLLLAGRELPPGVERRLDGTIVPLLAALVALQVLTARGEPHLDARAAGVAAAAAVFLLRRSLVLALVVAAAVTAALRLL
jgi:branched-subunit amino acid transport protein